MIILIERLSYQDDLLTKLCAIHLKPLVCYFWSSVEGIQLEISHMSVSCIDASFEPLKHEFRACLINMIAVAWVRFILNAKKGYLIVHESQKSQNHQNIC